MLTEEKGGPRCRDGGGVWQEEDALVEHGRHQAGRLVCPGECSGPDQ